MRQSDYDPGFAAFGAGSAGSVLHPVVAIGIVIIGILLFSAPRTKIVVPLLLGILLIPSGQNLNVGVHLFVFRILILIAWVRVCMTRPDSGPFLPGGFIALDKVFLAWAIYRWFAGNAQWMQSGAFIYQSSLLLDSLSSYFLFRTLIRDVEQVQRVVGAMGVVTVVSAVIMAVEITTGHNLLGLLGGIRPLSDIRNGRIRAQGVFQHSIIAGSFGATMFPLFIWLWGEGTARMRAITGAITSTLVILTSASSTPVGAWLGTFAAFGMWPLRNHLRFIRWAIVAVLAVLSMTMKAPIWYLLARIDLAGGSSGWNRANLIDTFFAHFRDWWLIGTHDNMNWGWDMWDQTNQFVAEGENGGLVALICFICMFVICFKLAGNARKMAATPSEAWQYWLLGTSLFTQILVYIGVDYYDQSKFVWYLLLAMFPIATTMASKDALKPAESEAEVADSYAESGATTGTDWSSIQLEHKNWARWTSIDRS